MQIQHSRLCLPLVRFSFPALFYFFLPVAILQTSMSWNQQERGRGGHFPFSASEFLKAVCGCCLHCSGSREWATQLNSNTPLPPLLMAINFNLFWSVHIWGLAMTLPEDNGCEAALALNYLILKSQWDTWNDCGNHLSWGKGIQRNVCVCFCWK